MLEAKHKECITVSDDSDAAILLAAFSKCAGQSFLDTLEHSEDDKIAVWNNLSFSITDGTRNMAYKTIKDAMEDSEKRMQHAIKCLKRKGLYARNLTEMVQICENKKLNDTLTGLRLLQSCMGGIYYNDNGTDQFSEKAWEAGIELAIYDHEKKRMFSRDLYGPLLEPNITSIYLYTILASYGLDLSSTITKHVARVDILDNIAKEYGGFEKAFSKLYQEVNRYNGGIDAVTRQIIKAAEDTMAQKQKEWESCRDSLENDLKRARKETLPLYAKNNALQNQLEDLQKQCDEKDNEIRRLTALLDEKEKRISELAGQIEPESLPDIPNTGIVFIGGHTNMVKKLANAHPEWTFIDGNDKDFPEFKKPLCVFFWDKHLSHPVFHRAKSFMPAGTPVVYLKSTNPERLKQEMKQGYWANVHTENFDETEE